MPLSYLSRNLSARHAVLKAATGPQGLRRVHTPVPMPIPTERVTHGVQAQGAAPPPPISLPASEPVWETPRVIVFFNSFYFSRVSMLKGGYRVNWDSSCAVNTNSHKANETASFVLVTLFGYLILSLVIWTLDFGSRSE